MILRDFRSILGCFICKNDGMNNKSDICKRIINKIRIKYYEQYFKYYPNFVKKKIRNKEAIVVAFILYDLSTWKSENLYLSMLDHYRFSPILAVTRNTNLAGNESKLIDYIESKKYKYVILNENQTINEQIHPDLIIYQRPYSEEPAKHRYYSNKKTLYVYVEYGVHGVLESWGINRIVDNLAWQSYFENELCAEGYRTKSRFKGRNIVVTGTPIMDDFSKPKELYTNPWKNNDTRKRIIWAPHHTIGNIHSQGMAYGTFLSIADEMLSIAETYKNHVYFAFKPHPQLYRNLVTLWGQSRTDAYYEKWKNMENSQYESGEYMSLFKYSDAMIHDCCTFTVEYLAMGKPVMYVVRDEKRTDNIDECSRRSFELHYHAYNAQDIRRFVENVIDNIDPRKEERMEFVDEYLRPPHGKSACENIMNAILGVEEYKDC